MTKRFLRLLPICVLLCLTSCTGRSDHWLSLLEQAEEMNRNDVPFTSDSIGLALVRHYDHWWHSPHLRLRAYYMLGSAYRDMGEAPRALENYQMAVKQVDIATAPDSTLDVLMRVHSQMSEIFLIQRLPEQEKKELLSARQLAWQIGDTVSALTFESFLCNLLYKNNEYEQCIRQSISLSRKFSSCNLKDRALLTYVYCVKSYLAMGNFPKAKKYLDLYETCSFFHDNPKMVSGGIGALHELKGEYFLGIANVDSAEHYFRKTLEEKELGSNGILGYKGMYLVFEARHEADSILKYTRLYSESKEKSFDEAQSAATLQVSSLYDYSQEQRTAKEKALEAAQLKVWLSASILVLIAALSLTLLLLYRNEKRKRIIVELKEEYLRTVESLRQTREALKSIDQTNVSNKELIASYQRDMEKLSLRIAELENLLLQKGNRKADMHLMSSHIVRKFQDARNAGMTNGHTITEDDWIQLRNTVEEMYPTFFEILNAHKPLLTKEYRLCLLVKAHFGSSDIDILMGQKNSYSTNIKKRLNKKVFAVDGSAADFEQKILHI